MISSIEKEKAIPISIALRVRLKYFYKAKSIDNLLHARIAIGIGKVDYLPKMEGRRLTTMLTPKHKK